MSSSISRKATPTKILGKTVGHVGFGLLGFARPPVPTPYPEAAKVMKAALEKGANFWNGSLHYGTPAANSIHLLHYYFTQYPEDAPKVILSIKGAYNVATHAPDGTPEGIRASVDEALRVLDGVKTIDIFECARVDPNVPIETSVQAMAELVKEGKIGGIGLSEVGAETVKRASKVHSIAGVEIELSLFTAEGLAKGGVVETCHELNIPILAYSPLARGFLAGQFRKHADLPETDFRRHLPRFQPDVFDQNLKLVEAVESIAKRKGVTVAQVAIAWVTGQGAIPIPGAVTVERVEENMKMVELSEQEIGEIESILKEIPVQGLRYGGQHEKLLNQ